MPSNNIDELLMTQAQAPAPIEAPTEPQPSEESVPRETPQAEASQPEPINEYGDSNKEPEPKEEPVNEYGLEAEKPRTYTQEEADAYANKLIRERLARLERNSGQQYTQQQAQQAQKDFQYDENSGQTWQQQLKEFIKQTNIEEAQAYQHQVQQMKEQAIQQELERKFQAGMSKFNDYHQVVGGQNITDAMVKAARNMSDPAAFFYAAAKRAPEELAKIAQDDDPYSQAAAIGRLDERLKKQAQASKAPKPVSRTQGDVAINQPAPRKNTIEDLIAQEDAKRQAMIASRRRY